MTATNVPTIPVPIAPAGMTSQALKRGTYVVKGPTITKNSTSPVDLFMVPAGTMVVDLLVNKVTAWDATTAATMTIGDSDDVDRFIGSAEADIQNLGWKSMKQGNALNGGGYIYTANGMIQATISHEDASNGELIPYLVYTPFSSEL